MRFPAVAAAAFTVSALVIAGCGSSGVARTPTASGAHTRTETVSKPNYVIPVATIQLAQPLAQYTEYVNATLSRLRVQLATLHSAADSGDVAAAERAWLPAHITYLDIGQDDVAYGSFGDLGQQIDGLADGLPGTTANPNFTGFHKVELDLWRHHDIGAAARDTNRLVGFVGQLTPARVAADLPLNTRSVNSWVLRCHEILEDGLRDSLTADDDYGSNSDLASLGADVEATREMLHVLAPLIRPRGTTIMPRATIELRTLEQTIEQATRTAGQPNLVAIPTRRRQAIDQAAGAALQTLAPVSEILQVISPGS